MSIAISCRLCNYTHMTVHTHAVTVATSPIIIEKVSFTTNSESDSILTYEDKINTVGRQISLKINKETNWQM